MKKILALLCFLLLPLGIIRYASLRRASEIRAWMSARAATEILVGVAWPFAANQDGMADGLLLAQEELNAHGVRGKQIRLMMRDDRMDREESRQIAIEFAHNPQMVATIGYYDDKFAIRASAIFEESHLLHIVAGANNTYMTSHGFRYLVRSVLANDRIGHKLACMGTERGYHKFAIVAEDGPFGEDLAYQTSTGLDAMNSRVVYHSTYIPGTIDFRDTVDDIKEASPDAILFLGLELESAEFIRTARSMGMKTPIVGSFSDTPQVRAIAGKTLEGVMFYEIYDVHSPTPENLAFVARYRHRFGKDPDPYAAQGYDALRLLAKAIETTGSTKSLDLAYAIRYMDPWQGANGRYKFDSNGELEDKDIYLNVYRGGKAALVASSHAAVPLAPHVSSQLPVPY